MRQTNILQLTIEIDKSKGIINAGIGQFSQPQTPKVGTLIPISRSAIVETVSPVDRYRSKSYVDKHIMGALSAEHT